MEITAVLPLQAEEFLSWLTAEKGRATNTLDAYKRDLLAYCSWLDHESLDIHCVNIENINKFVGQRIESKSARSSIARQMSAVRTFHRFMVLEGHRADDPTGDFDGIKVPAGIPKPLSEQDVEKLLAAVTGITPIALRDRALLEMLYATGGRISEICGLSLGDIDLDGGLVRLYGKGFKERLVPVGKHARAAVDEWLTKGRCEFEPKQWARKGDDKAIFLNKRGGRLGRQAAWAVVTRHGTKAGLSGPLSPHILRHSCATHMMDHGADLRIVQEMLGHVSISTTQIYTRVSQVQLFKEYRKAHPRATVPRGS